MRSALLAAAIAVPAIASAAQSAPGGRVIEIDQFDVTEAVSYVNRAACASGGTANIEWNIVPVGVAFAATGVYKLFASNIEPATRADPGTNFCPEEPKANESIFSQRLGAPPATGSIQQLAVAGTEIAKGAGSSTACDSSNEGKIVWVCAHWYESTSATTASGWAWGKFVIQVAQPGQPTIDRVGSGDGRLSVHFGTGDSVADHWIARATPVAGGTTVYSDSTDTSPATITGLENFADYTVVLTAYSVGGNPSTSDSAPVTGTPRPSADFWDTYRSRGGTEAGGCASGPSGALALLGAASLLAVRRRVR